MNKYTQDMTGTGDHIELPNPLPYYRLLPLNFRKHRQVLPPKLENNCVTEEHKKLKLPNIR